MSASGAASAYHGGGGYYHGGGGYYHGGYYHGGYYHGGYWGGCCGASVGFYFGPGFAYGYPYYGYPYGYYGAGYYGYGPAVVGVPTEPTQYVEQGQDAQADMNNAAAPPAGVWYYCSKPAGYYPYVRTCPGGWQQVPARPPGN